MAQSPIRSTKTADSRHLCCAYNLKALEVLDASVSAETRRDNSANQGIASHCVCVCFWQRARCLFFVGGENFSPRVLNHLRGFLCQTCRNTFCVCIWLRSHYRVLFGEGEALQIKEIRYMLYWQQIMPDARKDTRTIGAGQ